MSFILGAAIGTLVLVPVFSIVLSEYVLRRLGL